MMLRQSFLLGIGMLLLSLTFLKASASPSSHLAYHFSSYKSMCIFHKQDYNQRTNEKKVKYISKHVVSTLTTPFTETI